MNWHDYFIYDGNTGNLIWKHRPVERFKTKRGASIWNARYAFKIAGCIIRLSHKYARVEVGLNGKSHKAHRIIWEMHYGSIPEGKVIDHVDGDPINNVLSNLRLATRVENQRNQGVSVRNKSGVTGVCWLKSRNKWIADIVISGRVGKRLGYYHSFEDAVAARIEAEAIYFGAFSRNAK